ncbi:hypothetical protein [Mesorhizobium sp. CAU 1732]|uniref:hypothetical protein n=1 Tax=Mesorhizobium sp. CAU 1732 TaxID=3140358 RepID=UPI003261CAE6
MGKHTLVAVGLLAMSLCHLAPAHASDEPLARVLAQAIQPCWTPPPSSSAARISIALRSDGSFARPPEVLDPSSSPEATAFEQSAVRALLRCEPFTAASGILAGRKTEIVVNFSLDGMSLSEVVEPALVGLAGVDVRLSPPDGLCRVDGERSDAEAQYHEFAAGIVEQNLPIAFFLECGLIEAIRIDVDNFELPDRWAALLAPHGPDGSPIALPDRSLASAIDYYEGLFSQLGEDKSPLNQALDEVVDRIARSSGVAFEDRFQRHVDTDERAVYIFTYTVASNGTITRPIMVLGAFSQVFGYPITLNLYAPFGPERADELLDEAKRVMASLHEGSTRSE